MDWLGNTEAILLGALVLVLLWLIWVFGRRRWLGRQGGTFDCSARLNTRVTGRGWVLGVARYSGDWLEWHRVFGLSITPRLRFHRGSTAIADQRTPSASRDPVAVRGATHHQPRRGRKRRPIGGDRAGQPGAHGSQVVVRRRPPGARWVPALPVSYSLSGGGVGRRSAPGTQSVSPSRRLATRARMKSRSESLFR